MAGLSFLPHGHVGGISVCPLNPVVKTIPLAVCWHCCASVPLGYRPQSGKGAQFLFKANAYIGKESWCLLGSQI